MNPKRSFQRGNKSLEGNVLPRIIVVGPGPVTPVDGTVRVHEKGGEGQVIIKLEKRQVDPIPLYYADAHKVLQQRLQFFVCRTRNLRVEALAGVSWYSAENDQQRPSVFFRHLESLFHVIIDPG